MENVMEWKNTSRDRVELMLGGVECIELMRHLATIIETAKNRGEEQNARCLLIQLERAAESGTGALNFDNEEDYQRAWDNCKVTATA
jgi:hypothetical protein